jgi:hypothetical protein
MKVLLSLAIALFMCETAFAAPITVYYRGTITARQVIPPSAAAADAANKEFPIGETVEWLWTFDPDHAWPDPFSQGFSLANSGEAYNWSAYVAGHRFDAIPGFVSTFGQWRGNIFHVDGSISLNNFLDDDLAFAGFDWFPYVHTLNFLMPPGADAIVGNAGTWTTWLSTELHGQGTQIRMNGQFTYAERVPTPSALAVITVGVLCATRLPSLTRRRPRALRRTSPSQLAA